jgi:hypothetical protein
METKVCNKCNIEKDVTEFYKNNAAKDKLTYYCKICSRWYVEDNKKKNRGRYLDLKKKNREKHSEHISECGKEWYIKNKGDTKFKAFRREERREYEREYSKKRYHSDILYKLSDIISSAIRLSLNEKGYTKKCRTYRILGCTYEEFKEHIESQWEDWMSWDNHGKYNGEENCGWDLDHIIPLSSAKCEEDIIRLNHHSNIQPLCSYVNRFVKRDIVDWKP